MTPINENLSVFLHKVRWISAFAVVIGHMRSLMFVNYDQLANNTILMRIFYFLTGFGHQAVMIFFVLSGFLVGGKVIQLVRENRFSTTDYLVARFSRLYLVLIVALFLGFALDNIGLEYLNGTGLYDDTHGYDFGVIEAPPSQRLGLDIFVSNLVMCQTILTPTLGSNGPLWSLANEFWYYLLFPPLFILLRGRVSLTTRVGLGVLVVAIGLFLPWSILSYFSIWLFGAAVAYIDRPLIKYPTIALILFGGLLVAIRLGIIPSYIVHIPNDVLVGLSFALVISSMRSSVRPVNARMKTFHVSMSDFSYSLYAVHFPMLLLVVALLHTQAETGVSLQPSLKFGALYLAILVTLYGYSFFVAMFTERNTPVVRKFLRTRLTPAQQKKRAMG